MIADVAKCSGVPKPYLAKIINSLVWRGLIKARRGYKGGISLARPPEEITLLEIVETVEGKNWISDCLLGQVECASRKTCPTHDFWQRTRSEITELLRTTTLADVITACDQPESPQPERKAKRSPSSCPCD